MKRRTKFRLKSTDWTSFLSTHSLSFDTWRLPDFFGVITANLQARRKFTSVQPLAPLHPAMAEEVWLPL